MRTPDLGSPSRAPMTAAQLRPAPLGTELRVALMRSVRRIRQQLSSDALTDGQFSASARLDDQGPMTAREPADAEHVEPPSMTRTINALVADERDVLLAARRILPRVVAP